MGCCKYTDSNVYHTTKDHIEFLVFSLIPQTRFDCDCDTLMKSVDKVTNKNRQHNFKEENGANKKLLISKLNELIS